MGIALVQEQRPAAGGCKLDLAGKGRSLRSRGE